MIRKDDHFDMIGVYFRKDMYMSGQQTLQTYIYYKKQAMKIMDQSWKVVYLTGDPVIAFPLWEKNKLVQTNKTRTKMNFMTTRDEA